MRIGLNVHAVDGHISGVEYYSLGLLKALLRLEAEHDYVVYTNQPELIRTHVPPLNGLTIVDVEHIRTRMARILWEHTQLPRLAAR
ncbi:MAG: hypothetical protein ACYS4W_15140, partial [Planctomycetota bacterium]